MPATLAILIVARLPVGMLSLATLLYAHQQQGSYALAGALVAVYFTSMASVAPLIGRLLDRQGPRRLLRINGAGQPLALLCMAASLEAQLPWAASALAAMLMGALQPPYSVLARAIWRHRYPEEALRKTAFALDSVMIELNFTLGPALVGLLVALHGPRLAFAAATLIAMLGYSLFMRSAFLGHWQMQPACADRPRFGPLADPRFRVLLITVLGISFCFGLLEVGYAALATLLAAPALAGLLVSLNSVGSAVGGLLFGAMHPSGRLSHQYALLTALFAVAVLAHTLPESRGAFVCLAWVAGVAIAPAITTHSLLVAEVAPPAMTAEAFTWSSTCLIVGLAAGTAATGALVENTSLKAAFAFGAAVAATAACIAWRCLDVPAAGR
jgi:MFS family permease